MLPRIERGDLRPSRCFSPDSSGAFTLIELLVSTAVLALILVLLMQILAVASSSWRNLSENSKAFQAARAAFDSITRNLSQATLNVEYDYYNANRESRTQLASQPGGEALVAQFRPSIYGRASGLHFVSGKNLINDQQTHSLFFQAPLDFEDSSGAVSNSGQLNAVGYFVRHGSDSGNRPPNVSPTNPLPRERFRLFHYLQTTSQLDVYRNASGMDWFRADLNATAPVNAHVLAENIVALAILPKFPDGQGQPAGALAPFYEYDTRTAWSSSAQPAQMHQLPPVVEVVMVAIDEPTAQRNPSLGTSLDGLFQDPASLETDLEEVETVLRSARANYRIFRTDVPIRSAKWSL